MLISNNLPYYFLSTKEIYYENILWISYYIYKVYGFAKLKLYLKEKKILRKFLLWYNYVFQYDEA